MFVSIRQFTNADIMAFTACNINIMKPVLRTDQQLNVAV